MPLYLMVAEIECFFDSIELTTPFVKVATKL